MSTSTLTSHTTTATPDATRRPVALVTAGAAFAAAVVTTGYGAIAVAIHGHMQAGDPGASKAADINAFSFGIGTLTSCVLGVIVAVLVARFATNPARRWTQIAVVLLAVSLVMPAFATHTDNATRIALAIGHLIAGAIVIPIVRRRLTV